MKRYARLVGNVVAEIIESEDIDAEFHPFIASQCVLVPDEVKPNWIYADKQWKYPVLETSVDQNKDLLKKQARRAYATFVNGFFSPLELQKMNLAFLAMKQKAIETYAWLTMGEHYILTTVYSDIEKGNTPKLDFSFLGSPPHTYEQVVAELE